MRADVVDVLSRLEVECTTNILQLWEVDAGRMLVSAVRHVHVSTSYVSNSPLKSRAPPTVSMAGKPSMLCSAVLLAS